MAWNWVVSRKCWAPSAFSASKQGKSRPVACGVGHIFYAYFYPHSHSMFTQVLGATEKQRLPPEQKGLYNGMNLRSDHQRSWYHSGPKKPRLSSTSSDPSQPCYCYKGFWLVSGSTALIPAFPQLHNSYLLLKTLKLHHVLVIYSKSHFNYKKEKKHDFFFFFKAFNMDQCKTKG